MKRSSVVALVAGGAAVVGVLAYAENRRCQPGPNGEQTCSSSSSSRSYYGGGGTGGYSSSSTARGGFGSTGASFGGFGS